MGQRRQIGLFYSYNENWIGGTYYIENVVRALNRLPDTEKPHLILYSKFPVKCEDFIKRSGYPYIQSFDLNLPHTYWARLKRKLADRFAWRFLDDRPVINELDYCFPNKGGFWFNKLDSQKVIYWIPDFQELKLEGYFSKEVADMRTAKNAAISSTANKVVFSSKAALSDYLRFFPNQTTHNYVIPFAVHKIQEEFKDAEVCETLEKYALTKPFFMIPNQLWKHKNHQVVMEAVALMQQEGTKVLVINSGKEEDYRFPGHAENLKSRAKALGVTDSFRFLGFIPKRDLEILIAEAAVIIQPSLFEGWNTGIEEAKAQNKFILASDIEVHQEQLANYPNTAFFKVDDPKDLSALLVSIMYKQSEIQHYDYNRDISQFARALYNLFS